MYAVIVTGGKQYRVQKDDTLYVEKLPGEAGSEIVFDKVLAVGDDGNVKIGTPYVDGASVSAKIEKQGKNKKIQILRYRSKKHSMSKIGHRQPYTKVTVTEIVH